MKLELESTSKVIELVVNGVAVPARIREGRSENGVPCLAFITRVAVPREADNAEFGRDLVTVHHVHFSGRHPGPLDISHFISDRTETTADTPGKIIEAVQKLVAALNHLRPANTDACDEYREMAEAGVSRGLGYLKRLAIQHHLELMLDGGNLL